MKIAILSDIHANLAALEAVLKDIETKGGVDDFWCLGDSVDYGPQPHECLEKVRQIGMLTIIGNHDAAACGKIDYPKVFSADFIKLTKWTEEHLTPDDKAYLAGLPLRIETADFTLVHGSPRDPYWEYLLDQERAVQNLPYFKTPYCLVGHTHVSACFEFDGQPTPTEMVPFSREMDKKYFKDGKFSFDFKSSERTLIKLTGQRLIINPGSVGQNRDKDPRAAYAVFNCGEGNSVELRRVEYDKEVTLKKMKEVGMPERTPPKAEAAKEEQPA